MPFHSGQKSANPNGRPIGSRNKRDAELWSRLEARGDLDPADLLSSIVTNTKEPAELRAQAANYLLPYKYGMRGAIPSPRYIDEPLQLPQATTIEQAIKNIAFVSDLKATGKIDLDFADSLVADNRTILNALVEEQKLLLAQGGPRETRITIHNSLGPLPGTNISMPIFSNGHDLDGEVLPALPDAPETEQTNSQSQQSSPTGQPTEPSSSVFDRTQEGPWHELPPLAEE